MRSPITSRQRATRTWLVIKQRAFFVSIVDDLLHIAPMLALNGFGPRSSRIKDRQTMLLVNPNFPKPSASAPCCLRGQRVDLPMQ